LARTLSGLVAGAAGWRVVYWAACALVAVTALVLARRLPRDAPDPAWATAPCWQGPSP